MSTPSPLRRPSSIRIACILAGLLALASTSAGCSSSSSSDPESVRRVSSKSDLFTRSYDETITRFTAPDERCSAPDVPTIGAPAPKQKTEAQAKTVQEEETQGEKAIGWKAEPDENKQEQWSSAQTPPPRELATEAEEPGPAPPPIEWTRAGGDSTLVVRGQPLHAVASFLAERLGRPVVVEGTGADAPVYLHTTGTDWRGLLGRAARASGMRVVESDGALLVVDAARAASMLRARAARSASAPGMTRKLVASRHPAATAKLLARLVLGCSGSIRVFPDRDYLFVEETPARIERIEELVAKLEVEEFQSIELETSRDRRELHGVDDPALPRCALRHRAPEDGQVTVGAALVRRARSRGGEVVVGCGSDRPVYTDHIENLPSTDEVFEVLGVRSIAGGLLVAPEFARAAERLGADRPGAWVVRSIDAPTADMRALLEEQFAGRVAFYTYAPHRVMLAAGTPETLEAMAQWRETYAPIDTED